MVAATSATYWIKRPNKEEIEAVNKLNEEMGVSQAELATQQNEMANAQQEIITKVGEAETANEEANTFIAEQEADQQFMLNTINSIKTKQESGVRLTESEKALYNESLKLLNESNVNQTTAGANAQDEVASLYGEIEGFQGTYDTAAQSIGEIQGLTDYAESIDEATAWSCGIEAAAQGINAASGLTNAMRAFQLASCTGWLGIAYAAAGAVAAAGGIASSAGAAEQVKGTTNAINEIQNRKNTQEINGLTHDIYTQEIDAFAGSLGYIEDLDYEIPDVDDTSEFTLAQDKPIAEPANNPVDKAVTTKKIKEETT